VRNLKRDDRAIVVFVELIADRVTILLEGKTLFEGSMANARADERAIEVYWEDSSAFSRRGPGPALRQRSDAVPARSDSRSCRANVSGGNGAGKTTLLKCLMGAPPMTRGTCWSTRPKYWDGRRIDDRL
jgi:ABC-type uncharacterized transport system ATPase subunit